MALRRRVRPPPSPHASPPRPVVCRASPTSPVPHPNLSADSQADSPEEFERIERFYGGMDWCFNPLDLSVHVRGGGNNIPAHPAGPTCVTLLAPLLAWWCQQP